MTLAADLALPAVLTQAQAMAVAAQLQDAIAVHTHRFVLDATGLVLVTMRACGKKSLRATRCKP